MGTPGVQNLHSVGVEILYCLLRQSQPYMKTKTAYPYFFLLPAIFLAAPALAELLDQPAFEISGTLENSKINEASGLQAGEDGLFFTHNDQKRDVFIIDRAGRHLGAFKLDGSKSRDWEDITRVPGEDGPILLIADTGDNKNKRKDVELYFFEEPGLDDLEEDPEIIHKLSVTYPDGPRDVESVAYDPSSESILFLSKRDVPPRLYAIPLGAALGEKELEAEFLAEVPGFRPPSRQDILSSMKRGMWVSQPTGMDISPDGRTAAVITYRSLYLFSREGEESWAEGFQRPPKEIIGPPGTHDEAVGFSLDGKTVYVTTERRPAPIYRLQLP